jgi:hypothetical protein
MYGIQYGQILYDLNATTKHSQETSKERWDPPTPDTTGTAVGKVWDEDKDEDKHEVN